MSHKHGLRLPRGNGDGRAVPLADPMSGNTEKQYGVDGPPQLHGLSRELSVELAQFLGWSDLEDDDWCAQVVCTCGEESRFRILQANEKSNEGWQKGPWGHAITDLECASCGLRIPLFHEGFHGYNAVVCDEKDEMPVNYVEHNRQFLKRTLCDQCGGDEFGVAALARYDDDDLREGFADTPVDQWDDAYGWFHADSWCKTCKSIKKMFVGHETA